MTGNELRFDFFAALKNHATSRPDEIALAVSGPDGKGSFSWSRLITEIRGVSQHLQDNGMLPGDRVGILMENHPRWGVAFVAIQSAGGIAVPLDTMSGLAAAVAISRHAEVKFLISSPQLTDAAIAIRAEVSTMTGTIATEAEWGLATARCSADVALPLKGRTLEDPLAILYTRGTTGNPKGVLLTQRNLYRSVTDMLRVFPLSASDRILSVLPLFHTMPLLANLLAPLYTGARVLFLNQPDPQTIMNAFAGERITVFLAVPQFYCQIERCIPREVRLLLKISGFLRQRWGWRAGRLFFRAVHARFGGKLRAFGICGAYMNPKTAAFFADLGFGLFQVYGLTESGGLASVTPLDRNGGLTCGRAVANCDLRVLNPDAAGVGEILIRGENIMRGYWRDPDATSAAIRDGWLRTGDLGTIDESGTLRFIGRAKDVIVLSSGKNVFPEELEDFFLKSCALQEICFVGLEGPDDAVLHCVALANPGAEKQIPGQIVAAARGLPPYKRPGSLQMTNRPLPRIGTGELQRFKIRDGAAIITPVPRLEPSSEKSSDPIEREIAALIARMRAGTISRDTHLELDLHLDSLERVELIANVERAFGIDVTSLQSAEIYNVGDLIETVRRCPGAGPQRSEWRDWTGIIRQPLTPEERTLANACLRRRPFLEVGWYCFARVVALALRCTMGLKVRRCAEFPQPPFLLCCNHLSYLDEAVVASSLPFPVFRRIFALAASMYLGGRFANWIASILRILPIDQDKNLLKGLRMSKAGLESGLILCIFPEGTRSWDGELQEIKKGSAILACALQLPVVPVGIDGTFEAWPRGRSLPRRHPVSISIGEALSARPDETPELFNERIFAAMSREVQAAKRLRRS